MVYAQERVQFTDLAISLSKPRPSTGVSITARKYLNMEGDNFSIVVLRSNRMLKGADRPMEMNTFCRKVGSLVAENPVEKVPALIAEYLPEILGDREQRNWGGS